MPCKWEYPYLNRPQIDRPVLNDLLLVIDKYFRVEWQACYAVESATPGSIIQESKNASYFAHKIERSSMLLKGNFVQRKNEKSNVKSVCAICYDFP